MIAKASAVTPVAGARREAEGAVAHYLAEHRAAAATLPGSGSEWLRAMRELAIARFSELGFPEPRDEHWKYTRVAPVTKRPFRLASKLCVGMDEDDIAPFLAEGLECHRLVFVNGWYSAQLSRPGKLPEGVVLGSLAQILSESPDLVRPWLGAATYRSGFEALNTAFLADGAWVYVARGVVLEKPIHLVYLSTAQGEPAVSHVRNLLVAGPNSQARVIESYVALGAGHYFTNAVTAVALDEGAVLEHYKLQEESEKAFHIARLDVRQARDSRLTSHSVSLGGELSRTDIAASLDDEGAECTLNGLYMVDGRQHVDFHTTVEHVRPRGTSREYFKGILGGRSRGVFNGRVHVHPGAQKTDSQQANKNLLLSRDAEVDTKPELEIYADDVKCSHGATVGQLDGDMLFYLRSRGIDQDSARGLLTYGFAQDVIERMSLGAVRDRLERLIVTRVPDAENVKAIV
jgi:Fe-S cluster assembly protein SufD